MSFLAYSFRDIFDNESLQNLPHIFACHYQTNYLSKIH